jgi:hypothetical protein
MPVCGLDFEGVLSVRLMLDRCTARPTTSSREDVHAPDVERILER